MSEHGTTSRYTGGCRCAPCRGANAEYQRAYQAARKAKTTRIAPRIDASTTQTYGMSTTVPVYSLTITVTSWPVATSVTQPQSVVVDVRSPLDQLVAACEDLRAAFAAYHQAHTQEPAA